MSIIRHRAKEQLPMVLLTLLSIVQALALELLWGHVVSEPTLYVPSWEAALGWVQAFTTFVGILLIWVIYASTAMRFRWVPATADSLYPFLVGVAQFALVELLGPDTLGGWFLVMAVIYAAMTWISQRTLKAARMDEDNHEFFRHVRPATLRDFRGAALIVLMMVVVGILLLATGHAGWLAMAATLMVTTGLLYQLYLSDRYWRRSLLAPSPDPTSP
ncbi:MAG: hypothetical protein RIB46_21740 [Pseudomonadales bacterium]